METYSIYGKKILPNSEILRSKVNQRMDLNLSLEIKDLAYIQESILVRKAFRCGPDTICRLRSFPGKDLS